MPATVLAAGNLTESKRDRSYYAHEAEAVHYLVCWKSKEEMRVDDNSGYVFKS